jgi:hypothetical protein
MFYGQQIGVIVYGKGLNARTYAAEARVKGLVVVWRDTYATIHSVYKAK